MKNYQKSPVTNSATVIVLCSRCYSCSFNTGQRDRLKHLDRTAVDALTSMDFKYKIINLLFLYVICYKLRVHWKWQQFEFEFLSARLTHFQTI